MEAELFVTITEKYAKEHYPIALTEPVTAIKEAIEMKGLKDKDLIPVICSKTSLSLVLNRKRALTIDMTRNLSRTLGVACRGFDTTL